MVAMQIRKCALLVSLALAVLCFWTEHAGAAYKIILKNGTEFIVEAYEKVGNELRAEYDGGIIGIQQSEVRSVQWVDRPRNQTEKNAVPGNTGQPARKQRQPQPDSDQIKTENRAAKRAMLQFRINEFDMQIEAAEKQRIDSETELSVEREKMNSLQEKGRRKALLDGKDPSARWKDSLPPDEYLWVTENVSKIAKLKQKIQQIEADLEALSHERAYYEKRLRDEQ